MDRKAPIATRNVPFESTLKLALVSNETVVQCWWGSGNKYLVLNWIWFEFDCRKQIHTSANAGSQHTSLLTVVK